MERSRLRSFASVALILFVAGCATQPPPPAALAPPTESGPVVVAHLQERYDHRDCRPAGTPSVLCSGVLMRGTNWSPGFHSWIPNPATSAGGVAFSWLRKDSNFPGTLYPNGFIVYPHYYSDDPHFYQLVVNCGYVQDAGTGSLPDKCRTPCHRTGAGIRTAAKWMATYPAGSYGCAFKIAPGPAFAWMQIVDVRSARGIFAWNEIMVAMWPQNTHANMPLEAFFYTAGDAVALGNAQNDQKDFKGTAGRWVPIVRWTPPPAIHGRATFAFDPADQAIVN
jgi:hypothetical protein